MQTHKQTNFKCVLSYAMELTMAQWGDEWWILYYVSRPRALWVRIWGWESEEGPGWIERGLMGRNKQIFMNMHHIPLCLFVLLLKYSCSFTWFLFWSHFIPHHAFVSAITPSLKLREEHVAFSFVHPPHLTCLLFTDTFNFKHDYRKPW